jgi:uncharacterized protein (DUF433 family)
MKLPEFLTRGSMGEIRVTGHRVDLYLLVERYKQGYTAEMLHNEYPTLPLELIQDLIAFCVNNEAYVDEYMADVQARIDDAHARYQPGPGILRLRKQAEGRARGE